MSNLSYKQMCHLINLNEECLYELDRFYDKGLIDDKTAVNILFNNNKQRNRDHQDRGVATTTTTVLIFDDDFIMSNILHDSRIFKHDFTAWVNSICMNYYKAVSTMKEYDESIFKQTLHKSHSIFKTLLDVDNGSSSNGGSVGGDTVAVVVNDTTIPLLPLSLPLSLSSPLPHHHHHNLSSHESAAARKKRESERYKTFDECHSVIVRTERVAENVTMEYTHLLMRILAILVRGCYSHGGGGGGGSGSIENKYLEYLECVSHEESVLRQVIKNSKSDTVFWDVKKVIVRLIKFIWDKIAIEGGDEVSLINMQLIAENISRAMKMLQLKHYEMMPQHDAWKQETEDYVNSKAFDRVMRQTPLFAKVTEVVRSQMSQIKEQEKVIIKLERALLKQQNENSKLKYQMVNNELLTLKSERSSVISCYSENKY